MLLSNKVLVYEALMMVSSTSGCLAQAMYQELVNWEARVSGVKLGVTVHCPNSRTCSWALHNVVICYV